MPGGLTPLRRSLVDLRGELAVIYDDAGAEAGRFRAALLGAVMRLTPLAMAANIGCALIVWWAFEGAVPQGMQLWALALVGAAAMALRSWWLGRGKAHPTVSIKAVDRATWHAGALASLWALVPWMWFPGALPYQQVLVATVVCGMMGAGASLLNPLPRACLLYLAITTLGSVGALIREGSPAHAGLAGLLAFYSAVLGAGSLAAARKHLALLRAQAESARQGRVLALLLQDFEQHADEALWQTDAAGLLTHASPRLAQLLEGATATAVADPVGHPLALLLGGGDAAQQQAVQQALTDRRRLRDLPVTLHLGGRTRHLVLNGKRVFGEEGQPQGWRGVLADVTERVLSQKRLHLLAHTDPLTGLPNRLTLRDALAERLRQGGGGALLSLDLDDFKGVNDTLGHTAGDQLLCAVAQRLRDGMRPGDLVARLGGDEFAVLMQHDARPEEAETLAARLIAAIAAPFELAGRHSRVGGSVGIAMFGAAAGAADVSVEELFVRADMALYAAKEAGRGRAVVYAPTLGERSRRRQAIEQGLRQAIEREELELHWQPKVDIASWRVVGAEALSRWHTPGLGSVAPSEFIAVAEECGLIVELGRFALERACIEGAGPLSGLTVSVNVSPVQLQDEGFVELVRDALRASGLLPARLELEITENVFIDDVEGALQKLHALRSLGVRIALDDFGTGYSSLAYLRRFPFDTLKIDRAFVHELLLRDDARAIVHSIVELAATLGMETVCEGVETAPQLAAIRDAGCDQMQGFLASTPRPLAAFCDLLRQWPGEPPKKTAPLALH
jgi:diguanylate cyclase (GGDEF)-like protein